MRVAEILLIPFTLGRLLCRCEFDSKKRAVNLTPTKDSLELIDIFLLFLFQFTLLFTIFWFLFSCPLTLASSLFLFNACLHKKRSAVFGSKQKCHFVISSHEFLCFFFFLSFYVGLGFGFGEFFPFPISPNRIKNSTNLYRFTILTNFNVDNNRFTAKL